MADAKEKLQDVLTKLETERDELMVKLGLAKLEAREEWHELEKKMDTLRGRMKVVGEEAREAGGDVADAARGLAGEIREGFERIRKMM